MCSGALIELHKVLKVYPTPAGAVPVLKEIDLQIMPGEFIAIVGKSGSGKSTLLNMIAGIDRPTTGTVYVGGTPLHLQSENQLALWRGRQLGVVFQFFQLLPTLTLLENIVLPMELAGCLTLRERHTRARELLEQVGLTNESHRLPAEVSGGQQQRAAIARAMANDPAIIVADEPTGNLDTCTAYAVCDLLAGLVAKGRTVVMVTHDIDLSSRATRVVHIADGMLVPPHAGQHLGTDRDTFSMIEAIVG